MKREAAIRQELQRRVLASMGPGWLAIEEFWIPRSNERADFATVGSRLDAFEIKSERDTLKRLARQVQAYGRLFDRCTAVVADRHISAAVDLLPEWWGILRVSAVDRPVLAPLRRARVNEGVDGETLVRLLWRDEVHDALIAIGAEPDPRAGRVALWDALLRAVELETLKAIVRESLRRRDPRCARIPSRRFAAPATLSTNSVAP